MVFDIRSLDVYRKVPKDFTKPTYSGAAISIISALFIFFLLFTELRSFLEVEIQSKLYVDDADGRGKLRIRINVTTPDLNCNVLGLDIQDSLGRHEVSYESDTVKTPVAHPTKPGVEGCNFRSVFFVNRVPGNFHLGTHGARIDRPELIDVGHIIHEFTLGDDVSDTMALETGGNFKALNSIDHSSTEDTKHHSHDYFIKIVPTKHIDLAEKKTESYQLSYAHKSSPSTNHHGQIAPPVIWFRYELSPITVEYREHAKPLYHFITTICAIVGGTFTVAGIVDGIIFTSTEIFKKLELGKVA